ncbi:GGDEF and GAF domains-containing protein [Desulfonema limicola]|uniref:diguanylate cyclase n=1 Tax=Desulfonema limicola TaxID=45656 RepID=A0A975BB10_9BACT|nr:sensor domain-containing diguanylate cyclase [Desulfonema limicola]QTA81924.1 GGDEF and GAF domains-containing protein [Desulfonema limicola]
MNLQRKCMGIPLIETYLDPASESSDVFCNIGRVLTSSLDPEEVIKRVMYIIGDFFSPCNWSLLLMEQETGRLRFEIVMGVDSAKLKGVYIEKGEGIVGWVCMHGKPVLVEDVQNDPRFSSRFDNILKFSTKSIICVPLLNGKNKVVGAIELINKIVPPSVKSVSGLEAKEISPSKATFTKMDMKILSAIGAFTGIAAENAFLHQKIKELAMIDSLTGINNRHFFDEILQREIERVIRYNYTICVLMIDLDDFKSINDNFGHLTGDRVLRSIADILRLSIRESDFLARFGGDEFVILMPYAGETEGFKLANRIQQLVMKWNGKESVHGPKIGISIGVYEADRENVNNVLSGADQELYKCKSLRKKPEDLTSDEQMKRYLWYSLSSKVKINNE